MFPVIIMTGHGDVALAVEAIKLGAVDLLEKPFEDDRLIGMIETAIKQAEPDARSEAAALDIASRIATLSPRERQVMDGLIAGLSNKLIVREYDISPRTIEVYRANVMTRCRQPASRNWYGWPYAPAFSRIELNQPAVAKMRLLETCAIYIPSTCAGFDDALVACQTHGICGR
jgi:DNA-binding CsgD family transcriptional regulator